MTLHISNYEMITVITGAGISAPSGLPTFRGKDDSLWNDEEFMRKSDINYLRMHPETLEESNDYWYRFRDDFKSVEPNAAHYALAKAEKDHSIIIGTQNVDGLHQKAGSTVVHELHGTLYRLRCLYCDDGPTYAIGEEKRCTECGGPLRSATVLFSENLPFQTVAAVEKAVVNADLVIYVGTSGIVYPVAGFVDVANRWGIPTILINDREWDYPHPGFTEKIFGPCEEILPEMFG